MLIERNKTKNKKTLAQIGLKSNVIVFLWLPTPTHSPRLKADETSATHHSRSFSMCTQMQIFK